MSFKANKKFKREYDRLFRRDPLAANIHLLLCELANEKGQVRFGANPEEEIQTLLATRFEDPRGYAL